MTAPTHPAADHAHTAGAERNRKRKASALADTASRMGYQPYELKLVYGTTADRDRRAAVRRAAGLDRDPSVETWSLALGFLEARARVLPGVRDCSRCGWPVRPVVTESGNRLELDPFPHPTGTVWAKETPAGQRASVIAGHQTPPQRDGVDVPLFRQHVRSCPSTAHRRPSEAPRWTACGEPLDGVLAARDPSYTIHPSCAEEVRPHA